jgi:alpha-tubulin suppressor-like RCC1 family protein
MSKIPEKNSQSAVPSKMFRSKLQHVSVSCTHLLALTAEGLVFSWGEGRKGQLGHGQLGDFAFFLKKRLFFTINLSYFSWVNSDLS